MANSMHSERYQIFRSLLISARETAGLSQVQVAEGVGRPQSFVSKYERGDRRLDFTEFMELAEVLSIDMQVFIDTYQEKLRAVQRKV